MLLLHRLYYLVFFSLEIAKVEMQRDALLKEHEVRKRDLLILKYDKQRTLCDEIIERQRELIEGKLHTINFQEIS